jgi:hypothetical protein
MGEVSTIGLLYSAVSSQALLGLLDLMSIAVPGFSLLSGIGLTALPLWGQKNEVERSGSRPSGLQSEEHPIVRTHLIHRPARDRHRPKCGSLGLGLKALAQSDLVRRPEPLWSSGTRIHPTKCGAEWSPIGGRVRQPLFVRHVAGPPSWLRLSARTSG